MTELPCETCPLPDCDDKHPGCPLRQALREYYALWRRREPIPDDVKARKRVAYTAFYSRAGLSERKKHPPHPSVAAGMSKSWFNKLKAKGMIDAHSARAPGPLSEGASKPEEVKDTSLDDLF